MSGSNASEATLRPLLLARLASGSAMILLAVLASGRAMAQAPLLSMAQSTPPEIVGAAVDRQDRNDPGYIYRIGPEDQLSIIIRNEPDLSGDYRVRPDGRLSLPLVGDIDAAGRTSEDLAADIAAALARYVRDPVATVSVTEAHGTFADRIRIIGEGIAPRAIPYRDGMTALDAMTEIGGLPPTAAGNRIQLIRESDGVREQQRLRLADVANEGRTEANIPLEPGDVLYVPEGFFAGTRVFEPSIGIAETWTDNINFRQGDLKEESYITEIIPSFRLDYDTAGLDAVIDAAVRLQYRSNVSDEFRIAPDIRANSTTEIHDDLIYADLDASITRTVTDNRRASSGSEANVNNTQLLQTYRASPFLLKRIGSIAELETRFTTTASLIGDPPDGESVLPGPFNNALRNNSFTHTASFNLSNTPAEGRLSWSLSGQWGWIEIENQADSRRREVFLSPEYAVTPDFFLLAEVGYQNFKGNFSNNVDDPVYMGGFRWQPSPVVRISGRAGQRDGRTAYFADIQLPVIRNVVFTASASTQTRFSFERLADELVRPPIGNPIGSPPGSDLILRDTPTRNTSFGANLNGNFSTTSFSFNGRYQTVEPGTTNTEDDEKNWSVSGQIQQSFAGVYVVDASGRFTNRDFRQTLVDGGPRQDKDYSARAGLSYNGFGEFSMRLGYTYTRRDSTLDVLEFTENAITLSITRRF